MGRLIGYRLLQAAFVLLVMSLVVYWLIGLMPGDPIDLMISADPDLTPADAARLKALYGLDRPLLARWWAWLTSVASGDLGYSRLYAQPVETVLGPALANTLTLLGLSLVVTTAVAIPAGIAAALRPHGWLDHTISLVALAAVSMPVFWLALLAILVFAVHWDLLPASGDGTLASTSWQHLVLPVLTLCAASIGPQIRFMRGAMLEALALDHIRTARAKGASTARVVLGHALGHALVPVITILGLELGMLFSGALITETVFGWPGMGKLTYDAISGNDFNLAMFALLLATAVTMAGNLVADVLYGALDSRITYG